MRAKRSPKYWKVCPTCFQLVYSSGITTGNHICRDMLQAKREAELDMVIDEEFSTWELDLKKFWDDPVIKFYQYLAEKERE